MKKRQILGAIAFGSILAITGCGDEGEDGGGGSGGLAGSAGSGGGGGPSSICETLCNNCGGAEAECVSQCNEGIGDTGGVDLESCPAEQATLGSCVEANGCQSTIAQCATEFQAWVLCIAGVPFPF
jgi:hypothetical protein